MNYPIPCFDLNYYYMSTDPDDVLSKNFTAKEFMCPDGVMYMLKKVITVLQALREEAGRPVYVNHGRLKRRGYRTPDDQRYLNNVMGSNASRISAHMYGAAVDFDVPDSFSSVSSCVAAIREVEDMLGFREGRLGWKKYNGTWIHYDRIFEVFESGCVEGKNPFPESWASGVEW